jgi:predicted site-specific integrase-resolvase
MVMEADIRRWYSKRQLADRYSVSQRSIERWAEAGRFPVGTQFPNKRWYWSDRDVENYERALAAGRQIRKSTEPPELETAAG